MGLTEASISIHCLATLSQLMSTDTGSDISLPGLPVEGFHTPLARKRQLRPQQDSMKFKSLIGRSAMRQTVRSACCCDDCDGGAGFVWHPAMRSASPPTKTPAKIRPALARPVTMLSR
jgi:hypothetical protein